MPKLVIKHELPPPTPQEKLVNLLKIVLPLVLLIIIVAAGLSWYSAARPTSPLPPVTSAFTVHTGQLPLPPEYAKAEQQTKELAAHFEAMERAGPDNYEQHMQLMSQAETILQQLTIMESIVQRLPVSLENRQVLQEQQQYQKDYWEARRVFHQLRLTRFKMDEAPVTAVTAPAVDATPSAGLSGQLPPADKPPAPVNGQNNKKPNPPALPEGVKLPPGFCPLVGPEAGSCKPHP